MRRNLPICTAGSGHDTRRIFELMVDGVARSSLHHSGWKADIGRGRKASTQALRATFGALAKPDHVVRGGTVDFDLELGRLRDELDRHRRRLSGEPVVVPRVRLLMSQDPHDPWEVRLELVDDSDTMRWCTAADLWERNDRAIEVAREERHLGTLVDLMRDVVERIAPLVPGLGDWAVEHEPSVLELDLETAEDFIDIAPFELQKAGVELIGPERLIQNRVRVAGEATPTPGDDRKKQFGREALVEWKLVVGDEEISESELARAEEAGATLLHTGDRWVRLDADELRRKREKLRELKATRSTVTPLQLLQLANDDESTDDRTTIVVHGVGDEVGGIELGVDAADDGMSSGDMTPISDTDWVRNLLQGLPDERLEEVHESSEFVGELRHYQRRGLAWMQFLARLGLGGCLADDMGLGKTATTLAHLVERPGPHLVVCPLSVVRNWRSESNRFTPKLDVTVHHGAARNKQLALIARALEAASADERTDPDEMFFVDPETQIVITTYGLLPRDTEHLGAIQWSTVVLDEAQMVKNPNTKAARGSTPTPRRPEDRPHRHARREPAERTVGDPRRREPRHPRWSRTVPQDLRIADRTGHRPRSVRRRGSTAPADHRSVHPASHEGRQAAAPRPARQDRADRLREAHQGTGDPVSAGGRPAPARRRAGQGDATSRPGARRPHAPQADLQPPGPRTQGRFTPVGPLGQAHPLRRTRHRPARPGRASTRVHPVP